MALAIFDLDNTLLGGDSDHAWGEFACEAGLVDAEAFGLANDQFYADYQAGNLDIHAYLRHALSPLKGASIEQAAQWHDEFMRAKIEPMFLTKAQNLVDQHRDQGDELLVITATNRYIAEPIAKRYGIDDIIACEAEVIDGAYTGEPSGIPSYGAGKVTCLKIWLEDRDLSIEDSTFYSDSHNDLPLLQAVPRPVAVDPDDTLRQYASDAGWPIISLR